MFDYHSRWIDVHDIVTDDADGCWYFVRVDDRGDLGVYVKAGSPDDAIEAAEEHAVWSGWEYDEEDVMVVTIPVDYWSRLEERASE